MTKTKFFGKRQIVLAVLILALSTAIYINWRMSDDYSAFEASAGAKSTEQHMGDAMLVNSPVSTTTGITSDNSDFFAKSKDERGKARSEALAQLKEVTADVKADAKAKDEASAAIQRLAKNTEIENSIETIIKAKGFSDCLAIINDDKINVIVRAETLSDTQMLQIQDIVTSQTSIDLKNIKIIEVK